MSDGRIERGAATRERLVAIAAAQFGEHGYDATSIDAILAAAGVKRGALYHHFASKQELFDAALDQTVAGIALETAKAARGATDPLESLRAGCAAWLRMALDPAVQRIALIDAPAVVGWSRWREIDERHVLGGVRHNLAQLADAGCLAPGDVDVFAHMVLAAVNEAALMVARAEQPRKALAVGLGAVDRLLDGLVGH